MRRRDRKANRRAAGKPDRKMAGTRARGPAPEPGAVQRHLAAAVGVLALLGAVAVAPHAWDWSCVRIRQAPFLLEHVSAEGLERVAPAEIAETLAVAQGLPLVDLDVGALEAQLAAHPWIAAASVVRWPPDALRVRIRERVPLAVTPAGKPAVPHGVDETGTAFAPASDADVARLVAIATTSPPMVGEPDPRLVEALRLSASLRRRGLEVPRRVTLGLPGREHSAELRLRGLAPAIWIERTAPEAQLDRLALLLAAHMGKAYRAQVIDLRFGDHAVLREAP